MPDTKPVMTDIEKARPMLCDAAQKLWDAHVEAFRTHKVDLGKVLTDWAARQAQSLTTMEGRTGFERLCEQGCAPQILAALLSLFRYRPQIERLWIVMLGDRHKRQKATRSLERAATALGEVFRDAIACESEESRGGFTAGFTAIDHLPLSGLISELRFYVQFLNSAPLIARELETRSLEEVSRYLLASYIQRATGRFHDTDVSALLAELTGPLDYTEVAQRMWRLRNYERLDRNFSKITDFSLVMGVVIARST